MKKKRVLILHGHSSIEIFHTLVPLYLLASTNSKYTFKFKNYKIPQLHNTSADVLILVRKYHDYDLSKETLRNEIVEDIKQYKKKYKKVIKQYASINCDWKRASGCIEIFKVT